MNQESIVRQLVKKYASKVFTRFLNGWNLPIRTPNSFSSTENAADLDYLTTWSVYMIGQYDITPGSLVGWDLELFGVLVGKKPVAMLDHDHWPSKEKSDNAPGEHKDYEQLDYFLRYVAGQKCGLRKLIFDDDMTTLWYRPENWARAMLMYMFHMKMIPESTRKLIDSDLEVFDIWQAHILGYTFESIALLRAHTDEDALELETLFNKLYDIEANEPFVDNRQKFIASLLELTYAQKLDLYTQYYEARLGKVLSDTVYRKKYTDTVALVDNYLKQIQADHSLEIFAKGPNAEKYIHSFKLH